MDDTSELCAQAPLPHSTANTMPAEQVGDGDSDWEYEYSTTETETHLITLDLSVPEFIRHRLDHTMHNTRGGFRSWMHPLPDGDDEPLRVDLGKEEKDSSPTEQANQTDQDKPSTDDPSVATEIQILDLHGAQPVISYRGNIFTGIWTETIGTEMLFADKKDGGNGAMPAPALHLSHDIDLLGASTARITCTPAQLRRRQKTCEEPAQKENARRTAKAKRSRFSIPVNGGGGQRQRQAAFLEQLMALKHGRGENDVVTVQAVETKQNAVQDDPEEERLRRKKAAQFVRYRRRATKQREKAAEAAEAAEAAGTAGPSAPRGRKRARNNVSRVTGALGGEDSMGSGSDV